MFENVTGKLSGIVLRLQCVSDRCWGSALRKPADNTGTQLGYTNVISHFLALQHNADLCKFEQKVPK